MVKMLGTPLKKSVKLTGLAIVLVCAFAATLYYAIPDSPQAKSIAFALGPTSAESVNSSVYSVGTVMNVTFQNGTMWEISGYPNISEEFNSTDIAQILVMPLPAYMGSGVDLKEPYLMLLQYAFDWRIHTTLAGENRTDLGTLQVANYTFSFYSTNKHDLMPHNQSEAAPVLNYTLAVNTTGYWDIGMPPPFYGPWTWQIDPGRIQAILTNSTNPAEIDFDFDLTVHLNYKLMTYQSTQSGYTLQTTQSGYATVAWSGRWAELQLLHEGDQLLGFHYADSDIGLRIITS